MESICQLTSQADEFQNIMKKAAVEQEETLAKLQVPSNIITPPIPAYNTYPQPPIPAYNTYPQPPKALIFEDQIFPTVNVVCIIKCGNLPNIMIECRDGKSYTVKVNKDRKEKIWRKLQQAFAYGADYEEPTSDLQADTDRCDSNLANIS